MKKITCLLLVMVFILCSTAPSFAISNIDAGKSNKSEKMNEMIKKMKKGDYNTRNTIISLLNELNATYDKVKSEKENLIKAGNLNDISECTKIINELNIKEEKIKDELSSNGAKLLTDEEVQIIIENDANTISEASIPDPVIPPNSSTLNWWGYSYTYYTYDGLIYDMFDLYAQNVGSLGPLDCGVTGEIIMNEDYNLVRTLAYEGLSTGIDAAFNLASKYVSKVFNWIPVDLFMSISDTATYKCSKYSIQTGMTSLMYYLYTVDTRSNQWALIKSSNKAYVNESHTVFYMVNGQYGHEETPRTYQVDSPFFYDMRTAIDNYYTNPYTPIIHDHSAIYYYQGFDDLKEILYPSYYYYPVDLYFAGM